MKNEKLKILCDFAALRLKKQGDINVILVTINVHTGSGTCYFGVIIRYGRLLWACCVKQKCPDCHHDSGAFLCLTHKPSEEGSIALFIVILMS